MESSRDGVSNGSQEPPAKDEMDPPVAPPAGLSQGHASTDTSARTRTQAENSQLGGSQTSSLAGKSSHVKEEEEEKEDEEEDKSPVPGQELRDCCLQEDSSSALGTEEPESGECAAEQGGGETEGEVGLAAPPTGELSSSVSGKVTTGAGSGDDDDDTEEDDDDDETEIVEESPCGRWLKRREEVKYRDVPGIDNAFLAMDSEEGVEVVWNEASFSSAKKFKSQEENLKRVFEALVYIDHPNIVHFHKYWIDLGTGDKAETRKPSRLIFITEFMSSGSLKQFLRRTKKNNRKIQLQSWRRWCTQILSALSYLHEKVEPPIVHGNLTCDTIFIQHNGLVKIGSVAPDIIHQNVKTFRDNMRNLHYLAPEWGEEGLHAGTQSDIYSFGMCALEVAAQDLLGGQAPVVSAPPEGSSVHISAGEGPDAESGEGGGPASHCGEGIGGSSASGGGAGSGSQSLTEELIQRAIEQLEDGHQRDFIRQCLEKDPAKRPTARQLLFHPVLFEVHSLKLLAAHCLVSTPGNSNETMTDEVIQKHYGVDSIIATVHQGEGKKEFRLTSIAISEKLEKFMEDVKVGIYPITAFAPSKPTASLPRADTPENEMIELDSVKPDPDQGAEHVNDETRRVLQCWASIAPAFIHDTVKMDVTLSGFEIIIFLRFEDGMNRRLDCPIQADEGPEILLQELLTYGFVSEAASLQLLTLFAEAYRRWYKLLLVFVQSYQNRNGLPPPDIIEIDFPGAPSRNSLPPEERGVHFNDDVSNGNLAQETFEMDTEPDPNPNDSKELLPSEATSGAPVEELVDTEDQEVEIKKEKLLQAKEQWLLERYALKNYTKFKYYSEVHHHENFNSDENAAYDVATALRLTDPLNVTLAHMPPTGSFFCSPVPEDAANPYKELPATNNAFDFSHLHESYSHNGSSAPNVTDSGRVEMNSNTLTAIVSAEEAPSQILTPAAPRSTSVFTPSQTSSTNSSYDAIAFLQGAQKALEDLSSEVQRGLGHQEEPHWIELDQDSGQPPDDGGEMNSA